LLIVKIAEYHKINKDVYLPTVPRKLNSENVAKQWTLTTSASISLITIFYVTASFFLFINYGIKYVNDSQRYIEYATNLKNGFYFDPHNFWYFGYAIFLFSVRLVSEEFLYIILTQYLLCYLACLALYRSSIMLFDNQKVALVTALSFILFLEIPTWNSYILAESIYASFTCFSILLLISLKRYQRHYLTILAMLVVLFTSLIKPTGIALFSASLIAILYDPIVRLRRNSIKWVIGLVSVAMLLILANRMLVTYNVMENYEKER
jgi:hypothetical protein